MENLLTRSNKLESDIFISGEADKKKLHFKWFLTVAMVLSTYQLFLPLLVTYLPAALIFSFLCIKYIKINREDYFVFIFLCIYFVNVLTSFLWSSDKGMWMGSVVYGFLFFIAYFATKTLGEELGSQSVLSRILYLFLVFASINATLVIIFRILPEIESYFWSSGLISFFKNPRRLVNIGLFKPNIFDLNKSGGVFDNANTGAAFNLLCIGATISLRSNLSKLKTFLLSGLFIGAVFASGSKSAIVVFLIVTCISCLSLFLNKNKAIQQLFFGYFLLGLLALLSFYWAQITAFANQSSFMAESLRTMTYRNILWDIAIQEIYKHPFLGLGYGGWVNAVSPYKMMLSGQTLPPHNSLISAWIDTGFLAPMSIVCVWLICFVKLFLKYLQRPSNLQLGAMFAFVSVASMSMGDTFPIFGSPNIAFPLGFLVAYGLYSSKVIVSKKVV